MKTKSVYLTTLCVVMQSAALAVAESPPAIALPPAASAPAPVMPSMINPSINIQPLTPTALNPTPATRQSMKQVVQTPDSMGPAASHSDALPQAPFDQALAVAVCGDVQKQSDDCVKRSEQEATEKLSEFYAAQYAKIEMHSSFTVSFPKVMTRIEQLHSIARIEKAALAAAVIKMQSDVVKLTQERADKQVTADASSKKLKQWEESAKSEAEKGSNWTHDWTSNTHKFTEGDAYKQLKTISLGG